MSLKVGGCVKTRTCNDSAQQISTLAAPASPRRTVPTRQKATIEGYSAIRAWHRVFTQPRCEADVDALARRGLLRALGGRPGRGPHFAKSDIHQPQQLIR